MKDLLVETEAGKLQGVHGWDPRIAVYRGIPYAAPPIGNLRWRAPEPVKRWDGIKIANEYGPIACQPVPGCDPEEFWTREIHPTGPEFRMSEDCLYLNVYTPARTGKESLPVLVYIHGGGFKGGYPYEVEFDWEHMARRGIVVVAIAYRLGVLGFLAHPWLSEESPEMPKGNYGTLDQLAALRWVHKNIEAFGGNPEKITIAGQSAGAMSVQNLITSPMTDVQLQGAIIESSVSVDFAEVEERKVTLKKAEETGKLFFDKTGINSLEEARNISAQKLIWMEDKILGSGIHFEPVVDHIIIQENNFEAYLKDHCQKIPVLAGYNRTEAMSFAGPFRKKWEDLKSFYEYATGYGKKTDEFLKLCNVETDVAAQKLALNDAFLDLVTGARLFGYIQDSQNRKSYLYEFNADIPGEDHTGSYHGSEMWFAYDSLARSWRPFTGKHYDLARKVSSYWINFIKNGDPNGKDNIGEELPEWKAFTESNEFVMEFTDRPVRSAVKVDPLMKFRIRYTLEEKSEIII